MVLLDPRGLDAVQRHIEHALGEHAEGQLLGLLCLEHLEDLLLGEHALLDEDLPDLDRFFTQN